jgi:hypothetical protein
MFDSPNHSTLELKLARISAGLDSDASLTNLEGALFTFQDLTDTRKFNGMLDQSGSEGSDGTKIFVKMMRNYRYRENKILYFVFRCGHWCACFDNTPKGVFLRGKLHIYY